MNNMKITVIGSHLCLDTLYALNKLKEKGADINFYNISASFEALKDFLSLRENCALYEDIRKSGGIGIPYFEMKDGTQTLDLSAVLKRLDNN